MAFANSFQGLRFTDSFWNRFNSLCKSTYREEEDLIHQLRLVREDVMEQGVLLVDVVHLLLHASQ